MTAAAGLGDGHVRRPRSVSGSGRHRRPVRARRVLRRHARSSRNRPSRRRRRALEDLRYAREDHAHQVRDSSFDTRAKSRTESDVAPSPAPEREPEPEPELAPCPERSFGAPERAALAARSFRNRDDTRLELAEMADQDINTGLDLDAFWRKQQVFFSMNAADASKREVAIKPDLFHLRVPSWTGSPSSARCSRGPPPSASSSPPRACSKPSSTAPPTARAASTTCSSTRTTATYSAKAGSTTHSQREPHAHVSTSRRVGAIQTRIEVVPGVSPASGRTQRFRVRSLHHPPDQRGQRRRILRNKYLHAYGREADGRCPPPSSASRRAAGGVRAALDLGARALRRVLRARFEHSGLGICPARAQGLNLGGAASPLHATMLFGGLQFWIARPAQWATRPFWCVVGTLAFVTTPVACVRAYYLSRVRSDRPRTRGTGPVTGTLRRVSKRLAAEAKA